MPSNDERELFIWCHRGMVFAAYRNAEKATARHAAGAEGGAYGPMRWALDVVTVDGSRAIGAAVTLSEAHALSRMVRTAYRCPEPQLARAIIDSGKRDESKLSFSRRQRKASGSGERQPCTL